MNPLLYPYRPMTRTSKRRPLSLDNRWNNTKTMTTWKGLDEELNKIKVKRYSISAIVREVLPSALEKINDQLEILSKEVNDFKTRLRAIEDKIRQQEESLHKLR